MPDRDVENESEASGLRGQESERSPQTDFGELRDVKDII